MLRPIDILPRFLVDYVLILCLRRKYPGRRIETPSIGRRAVLGYGCVIGRGSVIGGNASIGDYSYVNAGAMIGSGRIGKFCSIAYYCQIGMSEHPLSLLSTSPRVYKGMWDEHESPPEIGNDVWIRKSCDCTARCEDRRRSCSCRRCYPY